MDKPMLTLTIALFFAITAIGFGSSDPVPAGSADPNAADTSPSGDIPGS